MSGETDHELLRRWRTGDRAAGDHLVRRNFRPIFRFFAARADVDAEDLTQKTFMACADARDRIDANRPFRPYLFGIARRQLLMHLRTADRRRSRHDAFGRIPEASIRTPSGAVALGQEQRLLLRALRDLPVDYQIVVQLFFWEEMPLREIAEVVEVPVGTVKSRLSRAKAQLRDLIAELAESEALRSTTVDNLDRWARSLRALAGESERS